MFSSGWSEAGQVMLKNSKNMTFTQCSIRKFLGLPDPDA
jgi:hypothetical protein